MKSIVGLAVATVLATASPATAVTIYGVDLSNNLVTFDSSTPGLVTSSRAISGFSGTILGIDFRPATGMLYGLSGDSKIFTINLTTGVATQVGASGAFTLNGVNFGFDFNPTVDRMRVVSDADQNLRLNPNDATLSATDGTLAYGSGDANVGTNPNVVSVAYTNSFAGSTTTTLYGIDTGTDTLDIINPPNNGTLVTVGSLGFNLSGITGFDIASLGSGNNQAFLSNGTGFYSVNLTTGALSLVGNTTTGLRTFAAAPAAGVPEPASWLTMIVGVGLLGGVMRRRRTSARYA